MNRSLATRIIIIHSYRSAIGLFLVLHILLLILLRSRAILAVMAHSPFTTPPSGCR